MLTLWKLLTRKPIHSEQTVTHEAKTAATGEEKEREWWEVVSLGRRYTTRFRDEAVDLCDLAASKGMPFRLWRVVAVERTRYVEEQVNSSPIAKLCDPEGLKP